MPPNTENIEKNRLSPDDNEIQRAFEQDQASEFLRDHLEKGSKPATEPATDQPVSKPGYHSFPNAKEFLEKETITKTPEEEKREAEIAVLVKQYNESKNPTEVMHLWMVKVGSGQLDAGIAGEAWAQVHPHSTETIH